MRDVSPWLVGHARRNFPTYREEALREIVHYAEVYYPPLGGWSNASRYVIDTCIHNGRDEAVRRGAITLPEGY